MVVVAFLAGVLTAGAVAASITSFNDSGVSCGAAISAALHGKQAVPIDEGSGSSLEVVTPQNRAFLTGGLTGLSGIPTRPPSIFTVCRQPARGRVLVSVVGLGAAALGLVFVARRSDRASPTRQEPAPVPA